MGQRVSLRLQYFIALNALGFSLITYGFGWAQPGGRPCNLGAFIHSTIGEWVGSYQESTNGQKPDNRYFKAVIRPVGPDSYEARFDYYRPDEKTGAPVKIGGSTVAIKLGPDGTATSTIAGDGQVRTDTGRMKPEQHQLCEVLCLSSDGVLQGRGEGNIQVSGLPMGLGKNGRILDYCSTWENRNGSLKMSRQFKVRFRALGIRKTYDVKAEFIARPGGNVMEIMKTAGKNTSRETAFSPVSK
jgi:hypothetical protein